MSYRVWTPCRNLRNLKNICGLYYRYISLTTGHQTSVSALGQNLETWVNEKDTSKRNKEIYLTKTFLDEVLVWSISSCVWFWDSKYFHGINPLSSGVEPDFTWVILEVNLESVLYWSKVSVVPVGVEPFHISWSYYMKLTILLLLHLETLKPGSRNSNSFSKTTK